MPSTAVTLAFAASRPSARCDGCGNSSDCQRDSDCRLRAKVSDELSNHCGANRQSRLDGGNAHDPVSSNVDMGSAVPIGLGTAYYLAGDGGDFSHAEDQEADEVRCRIAFGPFEVDVRETVSAIPHSQQQGGPAHLGRWSC
jgi:hypothetical protein